MLLAEHEIKNYDLRKFSLVKNIELIFLRLIILVESVYQLALLCKNERIFFFSPNLIYSFIYLFFNGKKTIFFVLYYLSVCSYSC